jgi:hypothetical protein
VSVVVAAEAAAAAWTNLVDSDNPVAVMGGIRENSALKIFVIQLTQLSLRDVVAELNTLLLNTQ